MKITLMALRTSLVEDVVAGSGVYSGSRLSSMSRHMKVRTNRVARVRKASALPMNGSHTTGGRQAYR